MPDDCPPATIRRAVARRAGLLALLAGIALALAASLGPAAPVAAHAAIERSDPPADGLLAVPPARVELWLTEAVDQGAGSPAIRLIDAGGRDLAIAPATVDPADPRHVLAEIDQDLGSGTFTVGWSLRSAVDGHTLAGSYAFRVGAARAPGSATIEGERPAVWAVVTRWLTFLGVALAAGGFAFARLVAPATAIAGAASRRRQAAIAGGGVVALLATLAEPMLQTLDPPAGLPAPALGEAVRGLPDGWWLRLIALALAALLVLVLRLGRRRSLPAAVDWLGLALGLAALLGLSLTSHAAARESLRPLALASNILHQWAVALWVGGLAQFVLAWPSLRRPSPRPGSEDDQQERADPVRRFSRIALGLAAVGVATGVLNSGLVLPTVRSLWESDYGRVLIVKVLVLLPVLALATFHRTALRRAAARLGSLVLPLRTIRVETALALLVVLGGSILTLLAPPTAGAGRPTLAGIDLAATIPMSDGQPGTLHLQLQPARPGDNAVVVRLTNAEGEPPSPGETPAVQVAFTPLDHQAAGPTVEPQPDASGGYAVGGVELAGAGWWQANVIVAAPGGQPVGTSFYLILPDPNVTGRGPMPAGTAEAEEVFRRGLEQMVALDSVRFSQRLGDGAGTLYQAAMAISDGGDGHPPAYAERSSAYETVIIGDRQWLRRAGQPWTERPANPVPPLSEWGEIYARATGFRLGPEMTIDGEPCQVVTFWLPPQAEPRREPTWFAWWVGKESGQVRQEAMISTRHYMLYRFADFNLPLALAPPVDAAQPGDPAATPATTP